MPTCLRVQVFLRHSVYSKCSFSRCIFAYKTDAPDDDDEAL